MEVDNNGNAIDDDADKEEDIGFLFIIKESELFICIIVCKRTFAIRFFINNDEVDEEVEGEEVEDDDDDDGNDEKDDDSDLNKFGSRC